MDTTLLLNFSAAIISIVNPIGNLPLFISYTAGERKPVRRWLAVFIALTILVLLAVSLMIGSGLLSFFGITIAAFRIAGGILLLLTGINMVRGEQTRHNQELAAKVERDDFREAEMVFGKILVPLGIPLFVGPGAISTVILYSTRTQDNATFLGLIAVLFLVAIFVLLVLLVAEPVQRFLGSLGLEIATRLLGLVLTAIGIQFILNGLADATVGLINPAIVH